MAGCLSWKNKNRLLILMCWCCPDSSNEALGIVQLEAMAAGRIALAFDQPRSGMGWVRPSALVPGRSRLRACRGPSSVGGSAGLASS